MEAALWSIVPEDREPSGGWFGTRVGGHAQVGRIVNIGSAQVVHIHGQDDSGGRSVVSHLPPAPELVGRVSELASLRSMAAQAVASRKLPVLAIWGRRGSGKSALAVCFANELGSQFPDGQFYVNLEGNRTEALAADDAIRWVLSSAGVPLPDIPPGRAQRVNLYRTMFRNRRVLLVLDNVADYRDIDLFVIPEGAALLIATVQGWPADLHVEQRLNVEPLGRDDSVQLLLGAVDGKGAGWPEDDVLKLAELCGGLPLMLAAVGGKLAIGRYSPGELTRALSEGYMRLSSLTIDGSSVSELLASSYLRLPPEAARAFRRIAAFPAPRLTYEAIQAITGCDVNASRTIYEDFANAGLLTYSDSPGGIQLPPPLWILARERLSQDESEQVRDEIFQDILDWYAEESDRAVRTMFGIAPQDIDPDLMDLARQCSRAFFWGEEENLIVLLNEAYRRRKLAEVFKLAVPLTEFFAKDRPEDPEDPAIVHRIVVAAAAELPDLPEQKHQLLLDLHEAYLRFSQPDEAVNCLVKAREIARGNNDDRREAELGPLLRDAYEARLRHARAEGDAHGTAAVQLSLASIYREIGDPHTALELTRDAVGTFRALYDAVFIGEALLELGETTRELGRDDESELHLREALRLFGHAEDGEGRAAALGSLAETLDRLGRSEEARLASEQAESIFAELEAETGTEKEESHG